MRLMHFHVKKENITGRLVTVKLDHANEQHRCIIGMLRAAAPKLGRCGCGQLQIESVVESDFYTKLKKLDAQEGMKDRLFAKHITQ